MFAGCWALPMLDIYQKMLSNCAMLLVPVERKKKKGGGGERGGERCFSCDRASILSCDTNKNIFTSIRIINFIKYAMLSTPCFALRAALSQRSTLVFWYRGENKKIQWFCTSDVLNCVHQWTINSICCSGTWLFPSCLQWWWLPLCLIFIFEKHWGWRI